MFVVGCVRPEQRATAALILSILIWAGSLWSVVHDALMRHYSSVDFQVLSGVVIDTFTPLILARRGLFGGRLVNRVTAME